ncbi:zinc-ribbon domain-containing protein [Clostridium sp. SM-530-WT-3G]|uniref:OB-fold protein n=1 Tax=Clostridium sp. SM-530-WT-3G TaxID=2725303 RepID=UPI00145F68E0|nr:zinc-ribbon domain-containing protein [Clostridium sp. SM-530-WT-3G]NME81596.1 zinc-ribbon domain-containing protein [Clostridium sp. SM-530-WT-3G]
MKDKGKKACKNCGKEIDKGAKECPHCGKVQVDFFDKHRTITIVIILIIILSIVSIVVPISQTPNSSSDTKASTSSTEVKESATTTDTQSDKEVSKEDKDSDIISAHKLASAYNADQEEADKLYKDKVETIKGVITDIGTDKEKAYVILDSDDPFSAVKIKCLFNDQSEVDKLSNLAKGEEVKIKGKILGQFEDINVEVKDCVLD